MESVLESAVIWVDQDTALAETLQTLKQEEQVAVDTESNSLYAYQEQVCLIQITAGSEDYVLDGLADMDLPALGAVFANESIEKIFHAAEYDILCLKRDFGYTFNNLFDTMQAARILGIEKLGLSNLLEDLFGVDQGKSFQKANWGKRPLTDEMLYYARMDTHYLLRLRDHLYRNLEEKNLLELVMKISSPVPRGTQPQGGPMLHHGKRLSAPGTAAIERAGSPVPIPRQTGTQV